MLDADKGLAELQGLANGALQAWRWLHPLPLAPPAAAGLIVNGKHDGAATPLSGEASMSWSRPTAKQCRSWAPTLAASRREPP